MAPLPRISFIVARQQPLPGDDQDDAQTLSGGAIAGIVLGSIAGFFLLWWIISSCTRSLGEPPAREKAWYRSEARSPSHHHHHHHHSRGRRSRSYDSRRPRSVSHSVSPSRRVVETRTVHTSRSPRRPNTTYVVYKDRTGSRRTRAERHYR